MTLFDLRGQRVVSALGIVQIFAWGATNYLLAVLAEPILLDTSWSRLVAAGVDGGAMATLSFGLVVLAAAP